MSIERSNFDQIGEDDLQALVTAGVPEGLRVEYKVALYGAADADRKEFAKDVSAFANTQGGHLLLGVQEREGVAVQLSGIQNTDVDQELLRFEQIAGSGIEPRISGLRMKAVRLTGGGSAILIRVPRSWNGPHRVIVQRSNRFYMRNSSGAYEPDLQELRTLFTQASSVLQQVRQFCSERIDIVATGRERMLAGPGRFFLHIVPIASIAGSLAVDMEAVEQRWAALRPIGGGLGYSPRFNYHGFISEQGDQSAPYVQVFRTGIIEAAAGGIVMAHEIPGHQSCPVIPGLAIERYYREVLASYINALRDVGVPPPLVVTITLQDVRGAHYMVKEGMHLRGWPPPIPHDRTSLPECVIEDYGDEQSYHRSVRPAFDALWNLAGYARADTFAADGQWTATR